MTDKTNMAVSDEINLARAMRITESYMRTPLQFAGQCAHVAIALRNEVLRLQHSAPTQDHLSLIANLAAVVRVQNGNLHADINSLLTHADCILSRSPATADDQQAHRLITDSQIIKALVDRGIHDVWHVGTVPFPILIAAFRDLFAQHFAPPPALIPESKL